MESSRDLPVSVVLKQMWEARLRFNGNIKCQCGPNFLLLVHANANATSTWQGHVTCVTGSTGACNTSAVPSSKGSGLVLSPINLHTIDGIQLSVIPYTCKHRNHIGPIPFLWFVSILLNSPYNQYVCKA
jgi:hypothetical protein